MKSLNKLFLIITILPVLFFASSAFAAEILKFPTLPCSGLDCSLCHLAQLTMDIITFLIELAIILAGIFVLYGGYYIMTAGPSPGNLEKGKKIIYGVIIGVVIMLVSWIGIDTIFKALTDGSLGPWNQIVCKKINLI